MAGERMRSTRQRQDKEEPWGIVEPGAAALFASLLHRIVLRGGTSSRGTAATSRRVSRPTMFTLSEIRGTVNENEVRIVESGAERPECQGQLASLVF